MALRYLFIDFDSFYASVEQESDPHLRGQPVAIVPSINVETTSCIAASYEAKYYGVKTGVPSAKLASYVQKLSSCKQNTKNMSLFITQLQKLFMKSSLLMKFYP